MADQDRLLEVPVDSGGDDGKQLQESVFTDTMAGFGGVGGLTGIGSLYYSRAQYLLARHDHDDERETLRAELEANYADARRALEIEFQAQSAALYGAETLNGFEGFGVEDDEFGGFGVE